VRTAILGLQGFFPLKGQAAVGVGSIEYPASERRRLAALSREWVCPHCDQSNVELLPDPPADQSLGNEIFDGQTPAPSSTQPTPESADQPDILDLRLRLDRPMPSLHENSESPLPAHTINPLVRPKSGNSDPAPTLPPTTAPFVSEAISANRVDTLSGPLTTPAVRSPQRLPLLLDTAICVLLVLVFALICRRI
jgi:ubiquitin-conjugating enzyme E2 J1